MKNLSFTLLILIINQAAFTQKLVTDTFKYKATYEIIWQIDSTNAGSVETEVMDLYLGTKVSRFSSRERLAGDSLVQVQKSNPSAFTGKFPGAPLTKIHYYIVKGVADGKLAFTRKIIKDRYVYMENLDQFSWKIFPETKEVAGYPVQKATTRFAGRNYIAWFTSEIQYRRALINLMGFPV